MLFLLNIPILILGFVKFGGVFIVKTAIASSLLSFALTVTDMSLPNFTVDKILAAVFGGVLMGTGLSLIMLRGATTGGIDIIAKLINRKPIVASEKELSENPRSRSAKLRVCEKL